MLKESQKKNTSQSQSINIDTNWHFDIVKKRLSENNKYLTHKKVLKRLEVI